MFCLAVLLDTALVRGYEKQGLARGEVDSLFSHNNGLPWDVPEAGMALQICPGWKQRSQAFALPPRSLGSLWPDGIAGGWGWRLSGQHSREGTHLSPSR